LLITEEYLSKDLTKKEVQLREQFWMLLYPTLNKSLLVSSNEGKAISEATRIKLSIINKFYQYKVEKKGIILVGSKKLIFSIKELSHTSGISLDQNVRIKDNGHSFDFIFFYFLLYFIVDHKIKKTKCDTVTGHMTRSHKSHTHVT